MLIKRIKPPYDGFWSLPGGKIEFGESTEDAVVREVREESGLDVEFITIRGIVSEVLYTDNQATDHFLIFVCETHAKSNQAKSQEEGEVRWFTEEELDQSTDSIIPSDYKMIQAFFLAHRPQVDIYNSKVRQKGKTYTLEHFGN